MLAMKVVFAMELLVALTREISLIMLLPKAFKKGNSWSGVMRRPAVEVHYNGLLVYSHIEKLRDELRVDDNSARSRKRVGSEMLSAE